MYYFCISLYLHALIKLKKLKNLNIKVGVKPCLYKKKLNFQSSPKLITELRTLKNITRKKGLY